MKQAAFIRLLSTCLVVFVSCNPTITPDILTETDLATDLATSTPSAIFQAVATEDLTCFFGNGADYDVTLPRFQIVGVIGKNSTGNWLLVRSKEFADCWIETSLLYLQGDINSLPIITASLPPIITPTVVTPTLEATLVLGPPVELRWKVIAYACNGKGDVTNVTVDLDISGGVPPYTSNPPLPIHAVPRQSLSITVRSNTIDGEPSRTINFTVPRSSDFKCRGSGDNPGPVPPVLPAPPPFGSTRCYDGKDNDDDGFIDYPADSGCSSYYDNTERPD